MSYQTPLIYAVKHKNEEVRSQSRSGGAFTALSDEILEQGGAVYGCVLTEDFRAIHVRAVTKQGRDLMRGSKYIQSELGTVFCQVREDLNAGLPVLFSGTSCQVAALKSFLGKPYEQLICVDIVCHGVPSPLVWEKYLQWQEEKNRSKVKAVDFRNKSVYGWADHVESLFMENGTRVDSNVFKTLFFGHCILRPCCHKCPYKSIQHPGDITIADYWGIDNAAPGFNDNKGVSLVLVNGDQGRNLWEKICGQLNYRETKIEDSMQLAFQMPSSKSAKRGKFWEDFRNESFERIARKYGRIGVIEKSREFLRRVKRKIKKICRL